MLCKYRGGYQPTLVKRNLEKFIMTTPAENLVIGQHIATGNIGIVSVPASPLRFASHFPGKLLTAGHIKMAMGALSAFTLSPGSFPRLFGNILDE
jgi:hypothetical protein|tara:strand:- start:6749 stop:7033 length:285 start_codon:yes stop_codon:yes gene_type:complete